MSKYTTVNKKRFTPFANGECQSILQSTRTGSNPWLMVDVKIYYSQQERVYTLCYGGCKNLLQSTRTGSQSHPLLMVNVEVNNTVNENTFLLLLNQYVFISSMHAVLKMFWLFDCCKCTIECIFSWNFIMNRLFQQIPIRTKLLNITFLSGWY